MTALTLQRPLIAALFLALAAPAFAQEAASFSTLRGSRRLKVGDTVQITEADGDRVKGRIQDLSDTSLVLLVDGVAPRTVAAPQVLKIERGDSVWNGLVIGFVGGLAGAVIANQSLCSPNDPECEAIVNLAVGVPMVVGGTVAAGVTDMLIKKTVYRAPGMRSMRIGLAPSIAKNRSAAYLTLSF